MKVEDQMAAIMVFVRGPQFQQRSDRWLHTATGAIVEPHYTLGEARIFLTIPGVGRLCYSSRNEAFPLVEVLASRLAQLEETGRNDTRT